MLHLNFVQCLSTEYMSYICYESLVYCVCVLCVVCIGGGEQRFTGRPGGGAPRQQQYRPPMPRHNSMEGVASMEQDIDSSNDGVIMVTIYYVVCLSSSHRSFPLNNFCCEWLRIKIILLLKCH